MSNLKKIAGILDPVQKTLCPDVWQPGNNKIWPNLKDAILRRLYTIISKDKIKEIFLIGSTAGYQWGEGSDIDLNVTIDPPELCEDPILSATRKNVSGHTIEGTRHPVNYFWVPWGGVPQFWGDSVYGVYDLLNDIWVADPGVASSTQDPQSEFKFEILISKLYLRKFKTLIDRWKLDLEKLTELRYKDDGFYDIKSIKDYAINNKMSELRSHVQDLIEFCHEIDRGRKFVYAWGYGIPRKSWYNILFKYMEGSEYESYFEMFKELKAPDYVTEIANSFKSNQ